MSDIRDSKQTRAGSAEPRICIAFYKKIIGLHLVFVLFNPKVKTFGTAEWGLWEMWSSFGEALPVEYSIRLPITSNMLCLW